MHGNVVIPWIIHGSGITAMRERSKESKAARASRTVEAIEHIHFELEMNSDMADREQSPIWLCHLRDYAQGVLVRRGQYAPPLTRVCRCLACQFLFPARKKRLGRITVKTS